MYDLSLAPGLAHDLVSAARPVEHHLIAFAGSTLGTPELTPGRAARCIAMPHIGARRPHRIPALAHTAAFAIAR